MNWVITGPGNGLSPVRRQTLTNSGLLWIGLLGTYFSEIWIGILSFALKKMQLIMSSAKMAAILSRGRWFREIFVPNGQWNNCILLQKRQRNTSLNISNFANNEWKLLVISFVFINPMSTNKQQHYYLTRSGVCQYFVWYKGSVVPLSTGLYQISSVILRGVIFCIKVKRNHWYAVKRLHFEAKIFDFKVDTVAAHTLACTVR